VQSAHAESRAHLICGKTAKITSSHCKTGQLAYCG
jgi:hypothetical protein